MATVKLTTNRISKAPVTGNKTYLFDSETPGLMVEKRATGTATFYLRYRSPEDERQRDYKIGRVGALSVEDARRKAMSLNATIQIDCLDPKLEDDRKSGIPTFKEFVEKEYVPYIFNNKTDWKTTETLLRLHVLPYFGSKKMSQVTPRDVNKAITNLRTKRAAETANKTLVAIKHCYNLALRWKMEGITENPAKNIKQYRANNEREVFLSEDEIRRLIDELHKSSNPHIVPIVKMCLLTGARRGEVLNARWENIDLQRRVWTIPVTKNGDPRYVQINDALFSLLSSLSTQGLSEWLFPNPKTGKPFRTIYTSWNNARMRAGLGNVRIHDLRHTFASFLINTGSSLYEVQRLLGHRSIQTTQRYSHLTETTLMEATNRASSLVPN